MFVQLSRLFPILKFVNVLQKLGHSIFITESSMDANIFLPIPWQLRRFLILYLIWLYWMNLFSKVVCGRSSYQYFIIHSSVNKLRDIKPPSYLLSFFHLQIQINFNCNIFSYILHESQSSRVIAKLLQQVTKFMYCLQFFFYIAIQHFVMYVCIFMQLIAQPSDSLEELKQKRE